MGIDRARVARELVGGRLRQLRLERNFTLEDAASAIDGSISKVSRMERGHTPFRRRDLIDLLALYGVTDPHQQETIISVALGKREPGWWDSEDVPLEETVQWAHEHSANLIRTYQPTFVPELLRTQEYAAAAHRVSHHPAAPQGATDAHIRLLMQRQEALFAEDNRQPVLWAVIEEPVLWRPIGGHLDMHLRQLDVLLEATRRRSVTIQVNLMDTPFLPTARPFSIYRFPDRPQMLAIHGPNGDEITELQASEHHGRLFTQLIRAARPRADTPHILTQIRDRMAERA